MNQKQLRAEFQKVCKEMGMAYPGHMKDEQLVVIQERPKPLPPKPQRRYGLMELQDEESREKAKAILSELTQVMGLIHGTSGLARILDPNDVPAARRQAYGAIHHHLGELLLGDNNPGWEEHT